MDIKKEVDKANSMYQIAVARAILSFANLSEEMKQQVLDSYQYMIDDYEVRLDRQVEAEEKRNLDEYLDNPRHGQAEPLNRGDF
jgi:hypothetical protein